MTKIALLRPIAFRKAANFLLIITAVALFSGSCSSKSDAKPSDLSISTNDNMAIVSSVPKAGIASEPSAAPPEVKREFHADPYVAPTTNPQLAKLEEKWGIQVVGLRLTSAGYMLDFRFKVIDPKKAAPLLARSAKPYLKDEASGYKFFVPVSGKVGALRQDTIKPTQNRIYYSFFANPGKFVKKGNSVTIVIGAFIAKNLIVQ